MTEAGTTSNWTAGRILGMVFAGLAGLLGLTLLVCGLGMLALHAFARDDDGFYTSDAESLQSNGYAITTDELNLDFIDDLPDELVGTLRVNAEVVGAGPIFVGIGRSADVQRYLGRVAHSELIDFRRGRPVYLQVPGGRPQSPPDSQDFWVASSQGVGGQRVDWDPEVGTWTVTAMNATGARGVAIRAEIGGKLDWIVWAGVGLTVVGVVLTIGGVILILVVGRRASRDQVTVPAPPDRTSA